MDLKSKLKMYTKPSKAEETGSKNNAPLVAAGGEKIAINGTEIWRFESRLSHESVYDTVLLQGSRNIKQLFAVNGFQENVPLEECIFFDLETTSLSTGTGNYPFLCGIGYCDGNDFVCEQLFMQEYSDEPAILAYMLDFFNNFSAVVSFNGNSFDVPLIKNRYMINRVYGFPVNITSFDLIAPSRRIFRSLYENCALQTIEKYVLGYERVDDTPGWMVPEIYFSYQKNGDASRLPGVIEHNRYDIFSMFVLIQILAEIFNNIAERKFDTLEQGSLYTLARYLYRTSPDMFLDLASYLGQEIIGDRGVFERFSIVLKRNHEWAKAVEYWEKDGTFFSCIELAKYYEHKEKDFGKAIVYCEKAKTILELDEEKKEKYEESLKKRSARLIKKKNR